MSASLGEARANWAELAYLPVRLRLLKLLASLFDRYGRQHLEVPLARAEMAEMVGTTTETVIRTLVQLQREGHLSLNRRKISVADPSDLRSLCKREALGIHASNPLRNRET
ncbi:MAG: helix-turn-helix domain-containing protein, partial [Nitrospinota bacterium]